MNYAGTPEQITPLRQAEFAADEALSKRQIARLIRDRERGYSINAKQIVLAFAVEFTIIGLILTNIYVTVAQLPDPSTFKTVQALLFPIAMAMVELARVPLAVAVRTQNSWNIKFAALLGVLCAVAVTLRALNDEISKAQTENQESIFQSQLYSLAAMLFGVDPQNVTPGQIKSLEFYLIFVSSIAAAFSSTLIAMTAVRRIKKPKEVAAVTIPDEAAAYLFGPLVVAIRKEAADAVAAAVSKVQRAS